MRKWIACGLIALLLSACGFQLRGTFSDVEDLRAAYADLPNAEEIDRLLERMMDGPSDELLSLL